MFLCIRLYVIGKEDSNERNPSGVSFVFVQVSLEENFVFLQADPFPLGKGCFFCIRGTVSAAKNSATEGKRL